jgi:hypothetical protein
MPDDRDNVDELEEEVDEIYEEDEARTDRHSRKLRSHYLAKRIKALERDYQKQGDLVSDIASQIGKLVGTVANYYISHTNSKKLDELEDLKFKFDAELPIRKRSRPQTRRKRTKGV